MKMSDDFDKTTKKMIAYIIVGAIVQLCTYVGIAIGLFYPLKPSIVHFQIFLIIDSLFGAL